MNSDPERDEWLRKVIEVIDEGVVVIQDEDIVLVNSAMANMLDYEKDELLDMGFEELVDPLSLRHNQKMVESLLVGEGIEKFSTRLLSKDGDILHVQVNPTNVSLEGKAAVLAAIKDISRQLALEAAVTELENRFAALYDMSPIAYFTLNRSGMIEQVNAASEELLNCSADEIIGRPLAEFLPEDAPIYDPGADIIREVLAGKNVTGIEFQMKRMDDRIIWVNVSSRAIRTTAGRPTEIGLMAFDVTRRRGAEQRLREESERANLYLDVMTNDLNMINQNTLLVLEDLSLSVDLPDRLKTSLKETSWSIRRAGRMIANIRVLLSLVQKPPAKTKTNLYPHFRRAVREALRDFDWKTLGVNSNIPEEGLDIMGHAYLWNVFFNLLHNSLMYDEKEHIVIDANAEKVDQDQMIRIEISDQGPGIADEIKSQIFKRASETEGQAPVRGLGLMVVDGYVSDMGGKVWVEDRVPGDPSQGSKFVVLLPAWKEALEALAITFFKSDHCVFCGPVLESLKVILDEMGISRSTIDVINVDDPASGVSEEDLPALPTIRMGIDELTGFVSEDDLRESIVKLMMMA